MDEQMPLSLRHALAEQLADSLSGPFPQGTPRHGVGLAKPPGKATVVVGMRRAGKTTYLHQLRQERLDGGAPRESLPYLNFEDERLEGLTGAHLGFLLEEYGRLGRGTGLVEPALWCFDEIQEVKGWERFIRRLLDTTSAEIFITGSSAALLSREIATALRGRAWEATLFPFSFSEALRHRAEPRPQDLLAMSSTARTRIERSFLEWLKVGGFPEAQGLEAGPRGQLLRDYVDVALLRDVIERHDVSNVAGLRWLVRHLLGNAGGLFSAEKFHGALRSQGLAISKDTIHHLLAHLEDCFLVRTVWIEASSERQRMVNPRKAYPADTGLIPIFDRSGRSNLGHALETAVLVELERRQCSVTYVRTAEGHEVDFLARSPEGGTELIQVCMDASDPATGEREIRALQEAGLRHPEASLRLVTLTRDGAPGEAPAGIDVIPAYAWMLEGPSRT
jgi:uncharacterized protein